MLNRKLWRDLWFGKTQFFSIFIMAFLGLFVFVGLDAESNGMKQSGDIFYEETNLSDLWIRGGTFYNEDAKRIESIPGVNHAECRIHTEGKLKCTDEIDGAKENKDLDMQLEFLNSSNVSKMVVISGEEFVSDTEGIWIDVNLSEKQKIAVGDTVHIKVNNQEITEVVKGIVYHPEYVFFTSEDGEMIPDYGSFGFGCLSICEYPAKMPSYTEILVDVEEPYIEQIKEKIGILMDNDNLILLNRKQMLSYATYDAEVNQHKTMTFMFPMIFLLIAILGIITTMTRMTANQRIQIGTLKALGFSKARITRHFMSYGFWISTIGSLLGSVVGYYILPNLLAINIRVVYLLPKWYVLISWHSIVAVFLEILISTFVSFLSCRQILKEVPAQTLKPKPPAKLKHSYLEKSKIWLHMSFSTQWNYRDISRNKARTAMGIMGIAGCTMLLLCAFGCKDSFAVFPRWYYEQLMTANTSIVLNDTCIQEDAEEYAKKYQGQMIEEESIEIYANNQVKTGTLTTIDTGNLLHIQNKNLEEVSLEDDDILLSAKMADLLHVKVGDYVKWHVMGDDKIQNTRITELNRTPNVQGITISREKQKSLQYDFRASKVLTNYQVPKSVADDLQVQTVLKSKDLKGDMIESMKMVNLIVIVLVVAAVVMGIIVLYNLGVLSFIEKTREIATLKVLGFRSSKIREILQMQNIWVTIMGIVLGLPLGYLFLIILCGTVSEEQDIIPKITLLSYLIAIVGTYAVSIFVNFMLSGKVKAIDMVDALKGVD